MEMHRVIAIDPGQTTGLCCWVDGDIAGQYEMSEKTTKLKEFHLELFAYLCNFDADVVVLERFQSRPGQIKAILMAPELIGVVKYWTQAANKELILQTSSQAKGFWDDKKLRRVGLWHPVVDV